MDGVEREISCATRTDAEGRHLAHVDPYPIKRDVTVPIDEFVGPPRHCIRTMPIRKYGVARPYRANVLRSIWVLEKYARIITPIVRRIGV